MKQLKAGGRIYNLYSVTGKIIEQGKFATTHVHGGGGSGQGGNSGPINISSSTTVHNDIFLVDSNGKEHSFQLSGFNIACRQDHELTVIWAVEDGKEKGSYIVVVNHSTSEQFFDTIGLNEMFRIKYGCLHYFVSFIAVFIVIHLVFPGKLGLTIQGSYNAFMKFGASSIIWLVGGAFFLLNSKYNIAYKKANNFKSNFRLEDYK